MVLSVEVRRSSRVLVAVILMLLSVNVLLVKGQEETPIFLDWHPNGEIIAVGYGNEIRVIDVVLGVTINTIPNLATQRSAPVWNSDGSLLAVADETNIKIWNSAAIQNQIQLDGIIEPISGFAYLFDWSPDGTKFVIDGPVIEVWSYPDNQLLFTQQGLDFGLGQTAWSWTSSMVASAGLEGSVLVWNGVSGNLLASLDVMTNFNTQVSERFVGAVSLAWTIENTKLVIGATDGTLRVWTVPSQVGAEDISVNYGDDVYFPFWTRVMSVDINPVNNLVATSSISGEIKILDLSSKEFTSSVFIGAPNTAVAWSKTGDQLAFQNLEGEIETVIIGSPPTCTTTIPAADVPALISAITAANGAGSPQTICLEEGTYALTAVQHNADGPNGLPAISGDVTLLGLGSGAVIQRDSSAPKFRILRVTSAGRLVLEKITICALRSVLDTRLSHIDASGITISR